MAATPVAIYAGASSRMRAAGVAQVAAYGGIQGGIIVNPASTVDQGLDVVEVLYVDLTAPATLAVTATTTVIQPGQKFTIPPGQSGPVWVNAATAGHSFAISIFQTPTPFPPTPVPGPFPPSGPVTVPLIIPAYLYKQYRDDADLRAFVRSYNRIAQYYDDWFTRISLPIYIGDEITGLLLDWVAAGIYGMVRPALASGRNRDIGDLNTYGYNQLRLNAGEVVGPSDVVATSDDIFKRIMTWNLYLGDGRYFSIPWLKRRIARFLFGENGAAPNIDQTYQISVTLGVYNQVVISLLRYRVTVTSGAFYNGFQLNTTRYNELDAVTETFPPLPNADIFAEALMSGALVLPFEYEFEVNVE